MVQVDELERLEEFVSSLLAGYSNLQKKNEQLVEKLSRRDEVISRLQKNLADVDKERSEIGFRITGLVQKIEQWETEILPGVTSRKIDNDSQAIQGSLFADKQDTVKNG